jgi:hypothetical protein
VGKGSGANVCEIASLDARANSGTAGSAMGLWARTSSIKSSRFLVGDREGMVAWGTSGICREERGLGLEVS